jgi:hypothetical protein
MNSCNFSKPELLRRTKGAAKRLRYLPGKLIFVRLSQETAPKPG